jgi:hypothetical protein
VALPTADWLAPVVSILALAVSLTSAVISGLAYRRAGAAERVVAWLELSRTTRREWMLATMRVKNPSRIQIKLVKLIIEVTPDFKMADYEASLADDGAGNRILPKEFEVKDHYVAMACSSQGKIVVPINDTASVRFLIYQASFSRKSKVHVGVMFETMEAKPRFKIIWTVAQIRSEI